MMRVLSIITGCIACGIIGGCVCADYGLRWTVEAQIVDSETGDPISGDLTTLLLLRDGDPITSSGEEGSFAPIPLEPDGSFEFPVPVGDSGSCGLVFLLPPPHAPLGDPPDEIEIVIRMTDGEELRITIPVLEEDIVDIIEVQGVPVSGRIDLGILEVQAGAPGG